VVDLVDLVDPLEVASTWFRRGRPVCPLVSSLITTHVRVETYECALLDLAKLGIGPLSGVEAVSLCGRVPDDAGHLEEESVRVSLRNPDLGLGYIFAGVDGRRVEFGDGVPDDTSTSWRESGKIGSTLYAGRSWSWYRR
jgi:hypothetical protein